MLLLGLVFSNPILTVIGAQVSCFWK